MPKYPNAEQPTRSHDECSPEFYCEHDPYVPVIPFVATTSIATVRQTLSSEFARRLILFRLAPNAYDQRVASEAMDLCRSTIRELNAIEAEAR